MGLFDVETLWVLKTLMAVEKHARKSGWEGPVIKDVTNVNTPLKNSIENHRPNINSSLEKDPSKTVQHLKNTAEITSKGSNRKPSKDEASSNQSNNFDHKTSSDVFKLKEIRPQSSLISSLGLEYLKSLGLNEQQKSPNKSIENNNLAENFSFPIGKSEISLNDAVKISSNEIQNILNTTGPVINNSAPEEQVSSSLNHESDYADTQKQLGKLKKKSTEKIIVDTRSEVSSFSEEQLLCSLTTESDLIDPQVNIIKLKKKSTEKNHTIFEDRLQIDKSTFFQELISHEVYIYNNFFRKPTLLN